MFRFLLKQSYKISMFIRSFNNINTLNIKCNNVAKFLCIVPAAVAIDYHYRYNYLNSSLSCDQQNCDNFHKNTLINECSKTNINEDNIYNILQLIDDTNTINFICIDENPILHFMAIKKQLKIVKYLVKRGANINLQDKYGETALHYACKIDNNLEIIKYLVEHSANINLQDNDGHTALYNASKINDLKVIKYLVEHGANVKLQNNDGQTALHNACEIENNLEIIKYLVEHGARISVKNDCGQTPLSISLSKLDNLEVITFLKQNMYVNKCNIM